MTRACKDFFVFLHRSWPLLPWWPDLMNIPQEWPITVSLLTDLWPWECSATIWSCCGRNKWVHLPPLIKITLVDNPSRVDVVIPPVEINDFLQRLVCSVCISCCPVSVGRSGDVWVCEKEDLAHTPYLSINHLSVHTSTSDCYSAPVHHSTRIACL